MGAWLSGRGVGLREYSPSDRRLAYCGRGRPFRSHLDVTVCCSLDLIFSTLLAPRKTLLLRSIVRTRFQFIVLALVAVEENDLLRMFRLRHGVWTSGRALAARAFWTGDAEAPASSGASASCYRLAENVAFFAVVKAELKFVQVEWQVFLAHIVVGADHAALEQAPERFDASAYGFCRARIHDRNDSPRHACSPAL